MQGCLDEKQLLDLAYGSASADLRQAASLNRAHLVPIWDVGVEHERVYVATEFVRGKTLSAWLGKEKRPWLEVLDAFVQAGRGLEAAHAAGLLHGDFDARDVLIGEDGQVRVADVGIAMAARGNAGSATAADDVFRFCTALSEALGDTQDVPDWVHDALKKGLATRAEDRFASMAELLAVLDRKPRLRAWRIVGAAGWVVLGMLAVFLLDHCQALK